MLVAGLVNQMSERIGFCRGWHRYSTSERWTYSLEPRDGDVVGGGGKQTFDNQALNTLFNYGTRSRISLRVDVVNKNLKMYPLHPSVSLKAANHLAADLVEPSDIFVTDPPYGDAVKYEEILDFFIGWLRRTRPLSLRGGSGTAVAPSPSRARKKIFAAAW